MASGHVNRIKRPNTWLHRPMLQNVKKLLPTRSRPHMALFGHGVMSDLSPLCDQKRTSGRRNPLFGKSAGNSMMSNYVTSTVSRVLEEAS